MAVGRTVLTWWQQLRAASLTGPGGDRAPCPDMAAGQLSGQMPGRRPGREVALGAGAEPASTAAAL